MHSRVVRQVSRKSLIVLLAICCFSLSGCLKKEKASSKDGSKSTSKSGVFKINLGQQPTTLNALSSTGYYASQVQSYILESLLERDIDSYGWKPSLATKWEVSKDGLNYTFTIREGVKWHDGKPLTVEDVKFSFDAIMDKENRWKTAHSKPYYENIGEAKVLDKNRIRFTAKKKYFRNFDVVAGLTIIPKHLYEDTSKENIKRLNKTLVGTGAYTLSEFNRGKNIILKSNKSWWGKGDKSQEGTNNFSKILLRFIQDDSVSLIRAEKGDIDFLGLTAEQYVVKTSGKKWGKEVFKVKYQNKSPKGYGFIGWNLRNPMFQSKKTRVALYHLINRDLMIEKFRYGMSLPATGPQYQQSIYADPTIKAISFDPKLALKLLKEDGWKDDSEDSILYKMIDGKKVPFSFTILEPRKEFVKYLTVFKEDAKKAGIDVKIQFSEWTTFIKLLDERKFEAVRLGWSGGAVEWDPKQIWHSSFAKAGSNFIGYKNSEVDQLIDQARETLDQAKRQTMLRKVYRMIAEDAPYAFLFNEKYGFYAYRDRVGRKKDTYTFGIGTSYWWIKK